MERRAEYVTDYPEYAAAGLDLVAAELQICELREELAVERMKYALALAVIKRQQERIGQLAKLTNSEGCV